MSYDLYVEHEQVVSLQAIACGMRCGIPYTKNDISLGHWGSHSVTLRCGILNRVSLFVVGSCVHSCLIKERTQ